MKECMKRKTEASCVEANGERMDDNQVNEEQENENARQKEDAKASLRDPSEPHSELKKNKFE